MEMSNFWQDLHVAQQSRRDKLRIQQGPNPSQHPVDYTHNFEQLSRHQGPNPDLIRFRNLRYSNIPYDPSVISTEMLSFDTNSHALLAEKDAMVLHQQPTVAHTNKQMVTEDDCFGNVSHTTASNFNSSAKVSGDAQNFGTWKSIGSEQTCEWIVNHSNGSTGIESSQNPIFVGEGLSGSLKAGNISSSMLYTKPSYHAYQEVHSSLANPYSEISSQNGQRQFVDGHFHSPFYEHTITLQDVVSSATTGSRALEMVCTASQNTREEGRGSWANGGNELLLLPSCNDQSNPLRLDNASTLVNRPVEGCHSWGVELSFPESKNIDIGMKEVAKDNCSPQGLSLSLSSVPLSRSQLGQIREQYDSDDLRSRAAIFSGISDSKALKSDYLYSSSKLSVGSDVFGSGREMVGTSFAQRSIGPLGPFTGYATILKSSKFLRPAQELLDEFCCVPGQNPAKICGIYKKLSDEVKANAIDAVNTAESVVDGNGAESDALSSGFYVSNDISEEIGGGSSSSETYRPEYQKKKAALLCMQEEVCRRYKQYHQQMQMVVSSFESVGGLSSATPYISLALKTVSRHFRCLKNAILGQLNHMRKTLWEGLSSPVTGTSSSRGDTNAARLQFVEHSFQKHKSDGSNLGFLDTQHVWRPQRGLPERAVSILRAWLFDHFLHPYPTDTDKQMLATQTGLSRNQVSNWFINARVRVWKPMVEEIHMLETKGLGETNLNTGRTDGNPATEGTSRPNDNQSINSLSTSPLSDKQVDYAGIGTSACRGDGLSAEFWNQKRSRVERQIPASMDGSLMNLVQYQPIGLGIGGLGPVSLTLGLRQSVESAHQQQQLQQQGHHLRQHLGGQMIHDLVN